jgi:pimeloyl-ACP methyl ester carboxylesterase
MADMPSLEVRMDDVRAVMDHVGCERAALFGYSEGGPMCALFAATYPSRTSALIVNGAFARRTWAPDHLWAQTKEQIEAFLEQLQREWGGPVGMDLRAPAWCRTSAADCGGGAGSGPAPAPQRLQRCCA